MNASTGQAGGGGKQMNQHLAAIMKATGTGCNREPAKGGFAALLQGVPMEEMSEVDRNDVDAILAKVRKMSGIGGPEWQKAQEQKRQAASASSENGSVGSGSGLTRQNVKAATGSAPKKTNTSSKKAGMSSASTAVSAATSAVTDLSAVTSAASAEEGADVPEDPSPEAPKVIETDNLSVGSGSYRGYFKPVINRTVSL
eukprot:TRINITY_DN54705_c0_g1_i1.p1 TRINITY_DN54705_c0_g1~~TRINITY_DN54705_c0_g1_i1.p1  ORF type:complete len:199 (+),score=56.85 TRINITY_DN54705_c0_g1_i1:3-599(+)